MGNTGIGKIGLLLLSAVLLLASAARADTLHLVNGAKFEGKLIEKTKTHYVFDVVGLGVQRFPVAQVARVEKSEGVIDEFERRRKALGPRDADAHYQLGLWCEEKGLRKQAKEMFEQVLDLDPDHAAAREKLGYVRYHGEWKDAEAAARAEKERNARVDSQLKPVLDHHRLGKSRRLGDENVWFWAPEGWKAEPDPKRPAIEFTGPTVEDVPFRLSVSALEAPATAVREEIDGRHPAEAGWKRRGEDAPIPAGPARGTLFGYERRVEYTPVVDFHALLEHGGRTLHFSLSGHGAQPIFLRAMLSDVLDTVGFERPPTIEEGLFDFRMPGSDWVDARKYLEETLKEMDGAKEGDKLVLLVRSRLLLHWIGRLGTYDRLLVRRSDDSMIRIHAHRKLGMSMTPVEAGMKGLLAADEDADPDSVQKLTVAGRDALTVTLRDETGDEHLCMFGKGDVVYNVRGIAIGHDAGSEASFENAFRSVLSSFRVP